MRLNLLDPSLRNRAWTMTLTAIDSVANPIASVAVTKPLTRANCVGVTSEMDSLNTAAVRRQIGDWPAFSSNDCFAFRRERLKPQARPLTPICLVRRPSPGPKVRPLAGEARKTRVISLHRLAVGGYGGSVSQAGDALTFPGARPIRGCRRGRHAAGERRNLRVQLLHFACEAGDYRVGAHPLAGWLKGAKS
jgi:hypothetical protein